MWTHTLPIIKPYANKYSTDSTLSEFINKSEELVFLPWQLLSPTSAPQPLLLCVLLCANYAAVRQTQETLSWEARKRRANRFSLLLGEQPEWSPSLSRLTQKMLCVKRKPGLWTGMVLALQAGSVSGSSVHLLANVSSPDKNSYYPMKCVLGLSEIRA